MIKGGVWKNTEDEILKAAVMKYGKNQWSRIASLLSRKSAKQCKARWYEWLDPSIKKTEWTREEDEKLLHLAKIMPTQWRTIAPIVGRTAAQCLERYEKLLDEAMRSEGQAPDEADDPRKLRPGEIDPNPEYKPARPDPVDMDEDEKEMLSEARARLANTRGKKAKRKAREKQLEEARRLASLQKRRELRAAGVEIVRRKKRRNFIDYNAEIPFEHKAPLGFYEVDGEHSIVPKQNLTNVSLKDLEGARRTEVEEEKQQEDSEKQKKRRKKDLPGAIVQVNKINDPQRVTKRARLILPAPVVSDQELEQIARGGVMLDVEEGGSAATRSLVGSYTPGGVTPGIHGAANAQRIARTPMRQFSIQDEIKSVAMINAMGTPLLGGESGREKIEGKDFSGITPARPVMATPNVAAGGATPAATPGFGGKLLAAGEATPAMSLTGGATPMFRDALHLNADDGTSLYDENVKMQRAKETLLKQQLKNALKTLPTPKNDYELNFGALAEGGDAEEEREAGFEEDMSDRARRLMREAKAREEAELRRRAMAIQRNLPRPLQVNPAYGKGETADNMANANLQAAAKLVHQEMLALLHSDSVAHPVAGAAPPSGSAKVIEAVDDEYMKMARSLVDAELKTVNDAAEKCDAEAYAKVWQEISEQYVYLPSERKLKLRESLKPEQIIETLKNEHEIVVAHANRAAKQIAKAEGRTSKLIAGYERRSQSLKEDGSSLLKEKEENRFAFETYKLLHAYEKDATPKRIEMLNQLCEMENSRETKLQARYSELIAKKKEKA